MKKFFEKRSKVLFICALLATVYVIYLIVYFMGTTASSDSTEAIGGAIATVIIMPHLVLNALGAIFNWVGVLLRKNWGALTGAILYAVGLVLFPPYFLFSIPLIILGFTGYAKQKKLNQN